MHNHRGTAMKTVQFPPFIKKLPQGDLNSDALEGNLLNSNNGQVLFLEAKEDINIPEHYHGDQWGIVLEGKMELTVNSKTETYTQGESYFIPGGTVHSGKLFKGFRAIDYLADKNRYQRK